MNDHSALWLEEIAEGSAAAFRRFYDAYARLVYRLALQMTKDPAEAEDVCQDIFMEVLHKADQYDPARGSVEAWLAVRTRCRAMDRLRKRQRIAAAEWNGRRCRRRYGAKSRSRLSWQPCDGWSWSR